MAKVYQLPTPIPGTVDVFPAQKYAIFGDDLATVTSSGYLNDSSLDAFPVSQNDIVFAFYNYNINSGAGSYGIFTVSVSNLGVITLTLWADPALTRANATESSNAVTANGDAGAITTSALTTAGAGSYAITWTNDKITADSSIQLSLMGGTNTTKNVMLQAVPGAGSAVLTIYNNTAETALDGTLILAYNVL